jgi:hypothetical protein
VVTPFSASANVAESRAYASVLDLFIVRPLIYLCCSAPIFLALWGDLSQHD